MGCMGDSCIVTHVTRSCGAAFTAYLKPVSHETTYVLRVRTTYSASALRTPRPHNVPRVRTTYPASALRSALHS